MDFQKAPSKGKPVELKPAEPVKVEPGTFAAKTAQLREARGQIPPKVEPSPKYAPPPKAAPPKATKQTQIPVMTTEMILNALSSDWQDIRDLITKLRIKDMMDARFLQIKLKNLERSGQVIVDIKMGKKHWKLK